MKTGIGRYMAGNLWKNKFNRILVIRNFALSKKNPAQLSHVVFI